MRQEQRSKKAEVYEGFLAFWFAFYLRKESADSSNKRKNSADATADEISEYMNEYTHKMVTWGSEPVLKEYAAFKDKIKEGGALLEFENLLRAVRKDLGYSNKKLKSGDLLKVFVNSSEVDEYVQRQSRDAR